MIAAFVLVLIIMVLMGFFAPFLSPYDPTIAGRDNPDLRKWRAADPQILG